MKTCSKCKTSKPLDQFRVKTRKGRQYHESWCRSCERANSALPRNAEARAVYAATFRGIIAARLSAHRRRFKNGNVTIDEWMDKLEKRSYRCTYCGAEREPADLHIEHLISFINGGLHNIDNVEPACQLCNVSKNSRSIDEFYAWIEMVHKRRKFVYRMLERLPAGR